MIKAIRVSQGEQGLESHLVTLAEADLGPGEVTIAVDYSTINYKDGLAISGRAQVLGPLPMVPGIDLAGVVEASESPDWRPGDRVVIHGWGLGASHNGGLAQRARVPAAWLARLPEAISTFHAAAIGTAGFTAMLSVLALERGGVTPASGEVLVTGANGGAGSVAIALLAGLGYRVTASTGRLGEADYLKALGATEVIDRATLSAPGQPLQAPRWAGAVDSVGSQTLANVLAQTVYGGTVAAFGLAQGIDLPTTVIPFISRAVTLAGVDSVNAPRALRDLAYARLARDLDLAKLETMTRTIPLAEAPEVARGIFGGGIQGRVVVDVNA